MIHIKANTYKYRFGTVLYYHSGEFKEKCLYIRHNQESDMAVIIFKDNNEVMEVSYKYLERCFR